MQIKILWQKLTVILLTLALMFSFSACGSKETVASDDDTKLNYGDAVDDEEDDDQVASGTIKTTGGKKTSTVGNDNVEDYGNQYNTSSNTGIDPSAKEKFFAKVPKNLKGKKVKIYAFYAERDYEKAKFEEFTKNTGIKIDFIEQEGTDVTPYYNKLTSMIGSGNSPDLAVVLSTYYPSVYMRGQFQEISAGKLDLTNDTIYDLQTMNYMKVDGKMYGAVVKGSTNIDLAMLFYNADMFKQAGVKTPNDYFKEGNWNWETFVECAKAMKAKGYTPLSGEGGGPRIVYTAGVPMVGMQNGKLVSNMKNQTLRDAWKWLDKLELEYGVADWTLNRRGFMAGKCAMTMEESWALQKDERYNDVSFSYGYVPMPSPKGQTLTVPATPKLWGFPVGAKNVEAASYVFEYWQDTKYDVKDHEMYVNDSATQFIYWLYNQKLCYSFYDGIVEYGGDYDASTMIGELVNANDNLITKFDKWTKVVDEKINQINKEWG